MAVYIVRYNVEFSKAFEAESEEAAIQLALKGEEDDWDQVAASQYEAELQ